MKTLKTRQTNIELLRILAMLMVIILHYLGKGGFLTAESLKQQPLYALLETLCIVAVNVYVLISGYFLIQSEFSLKKLLRLWAQILFYSLLIPPVLSLFGVISFSDKTIYDFLFYIFPVFMEHYWFATTYLFLYLLAPFLNKGIKACTKKQLQFFLLLFVLIFSVSKSILPVKLAFDEAGYDIFWFITLYLTAAYIRLHGITFLQTKAKSMGLYVLATLASNVVMVALYFIKQRFGIMGDRTTMTWNYNHILVYLASIGLFTFFLQLPNFSGTVAKVILAISSTTFGVYLLHEHIEVRYIWMKGTMGTVLLVYILGIIIDLIRQGIFSFVEKRIFKGGNARNEAL